MIQLHHPQTPPLAHPNIPTALPRPRNPKPRPALRHVAATKPPAALIVRPLVAGHALAAPQRVRGVVLLLDGAQAGVVGAVEGVLPVGLVLVALYHSFPSVQFSCGLSHLFFVGKDSACGLRERSTYLVDVAPSIRTQLAHRAPDLVGHALLDLLRCCRGQRVAPAGFNDEVRTGGAPGRVQRGVFFVLGTRDQAACDDVRVDTELCFREESA